jgi:hypothetical protein
MLSALGKVIQNQMDQFVSGSLCRKIISPKFYDRKAILPKHHLTESPFNRTPFDRKFILPEGNMTDFFFQKMVI